MFILQSSLRAAVLLIQEFYNTVTTVASFIVVVCDVLQSAVQHCERVGRSTGDERSRRRFAVGV